MANLSLRLISLPFILIFISKTSSEFALPCINCTKEGPCKFDIYLATCQVKVQDLYPVEITVIFNHCHKPTDITFVLKAVHQNLNWKYTFVTSNIFESHEVGGFMADHVVGLRVEMRNDGEHAVNVSADFQVDGVNDVTVMNTTVRISTLNDCSPLGAENMGRILLGVLLTSVLAILFVGIIIHTCVRRVRKNVKCERFPLVDDAESVARASTSFTVTPETPSEPFTVLGGSGHRAEATDGFSPEAVATVNGYLVNSNKYNPRT